jgi:hypothetical protein
MPEPKLEVLEPDYGGQVRIKLPTGKFIELRWVDMKQSVRIHCGMEDINISPQAANSFDLMVGTK